MGVLVFDCVAFCLTLYKAFTMGSGIRLLNVIVRDGRSSLVSNTSRIRIHHPHVPGTMYFSYESFCLFADKTSTTIWNRALFIINLVNILTLWVRQVFFCQPSDIQ